MKYIRFFIGLMAILSATLSFTSCGDDDSAGPGCTDTITCKNGGTWLSSDCRCECPEGYGGINCDTMLPPTNGLVLYYPFNGDAKNESPNSPPGTDGFISGATKAADRFGNTGSAYRFDGKDDYIEVANHEAYNFDKSKNFTVSVWISAAYSQIETDPRNDNEIISKLPPAGSPPDANGYPFKLTIVNKGENEGQVIGRTYGGSSDCPGGNLLTGGALNDEAFRHLVLVRKGSYLIYYLNGEEVDRIQEDFPSGCDTKNTGNLKIGQGDDLENFKGIIDDLRIYDRALIEDEIKALFNEQPE